MYGALFKKWNSKDCKRKKNEWFWAAALVPERNNEKKREGEKGSIKKRSLPPGSRGVEKSCLKWKCLKKFIIFEINYKINLRSWIFA